MAFWQKIIRSNFFIKLRSWEYWPFGIVQFPVMVYYGWLSLRARSFLFFSASNPGIPMGGMFGESKFDVLEKVPPTHTPRTILIRQPAKAKDVVDALAKAGLAFPLIFKPDIGERGFMVQKISNAHDVERYLVKMKFDFLAQELVDLPIELGIFYKRMPGEMKGRVTSVVMKEMLSVTGDGQTTLQDLILAKDRAKLQWDSLQQKYNGKLQEVPPAGKSIELVSIGNHCLGTMFLDGSHLINEKLTREMDQVSQRIEGFYYGRFDLRCASFDDLYEGRFKVMELNGCGAEPAHIYHPGFSIWDAQKVLFDHWRTIFDIARLNASQGKPYITVKDARVYYRKFKAATQAV